MSLFLDIGEGAGLAGARLSGGGARSAFWRQMLADVFGKPVVTLETQEGSAYGAAIPTASRHWRGGHLAPA